MNTLITIIQILVMCAIAYLLIVAGAAFTCATYKLFKDLREEGRDRK